MDQDQHLLRPGEEMWINVRDPVRIKNSMDQPIRVTLKDGAERAYDCVIEEVPPEEIAEADRQAKQEALGLKKKED